MSDHLEHGPGQTGTGESRSGETESIEPDTAAAASEQVSDRAMDPAATTGSRITEQGTGFANRSGSGGSGGSGDPLDEGSGGQTMDELLQGGGPPESQPRH
jgi:hypothetical protein